MTETEVTTVQAKLVSVRVGRVAPLGPRGVPSGFVKSPAEGAVRVERLGLAGDEQADLRVHGGPNKAVYCYPFTHYQRWRQTHPRHAELLQPGAFGENLTIDGLDEEDVVLGDRLRIGTAVLEVCQPRQPCFKLALRFNDALMVRAMVETGQCGWYVRVIEPGSLAAGDAVVHEPAPARDWTIARFASLINQRAPAAHFGRASLEALAAIPNLPRPWPAYLREELANL